MSDLGPHPASVTRMPLDGLAVSPQVSGGARRFYAMMQASPFGLSMFAIGVPLFIWWDIWPLVAANVVGLGAWLVVMHLSRLGRFRLSAGLVFATMSVGAVLAVVFVGWGFGGQYVLFVQLVASVLNPWPRWASVALSITAAVIFILLYYYSHVQAPLYQVPAEPLAVANILNIFAIFTIAGFLVAFPVGVADRAEAELAAEHVRSERLLTNILPAPVAMRLKAGQEPIADRVDAASVLFADIVDFTPLATRLPAEKVVALLDSVFTLLDRLVDEHNVEKIKTIGDAYMVASGVPVARRDHAQVLARFALAVRDQVAAWEPAEPALQLRIGIASGPVVAGVIGRRRLLYDLWGDTVNTAARMESHGLPGRIQITETTRLMLGNEFECVDRGFIEIKGKGTMRAHMLERSLTP